MGDFRILAVEDDKVAITLGRDVIYAEKKRLLKIDLPTSWDKQMLNATNYITCNPKTKLISINDMISKKVIVVTQSDYMTALRIFKYRYCEGEV